MSPQLNGYVVWVGGPFDGMETSGAERLVRTLEHPRRFVRVDKTLTAYKATKIRDDGKLQMEPWTIPEEENEQN